MFLYFWMIMFSSAMLPMQSLVSLNHTVVRVPAPIVATQITKVAAQPAAPKRRARAAARPIMALGWVSEDEAPIF